jgi:8-hydroxy-5-deazaflavin:NADPH oxidoreductase
VQEQTIAVVGGTGQQGSGLAQRLARAGAPVTIGSREPGRAGAAIEAWPAQAGTIRAASYREAIASANVVILAVPFNTLSDLLSQYRDTFVSGALVVDVTVPLIFSGGTVRLAEVPEGSAAEHVKARLPDHVRTAATFKTVPARLLNDTALPLDCDELVCGDSAEARERAMALVRMVEGLRPIDAGPLSRAGAIEHLTLLAVGLNRLHKIHDARFRVVGL